MFFAAFDTRVAMKWVRLIGFASGRMDKFMKACGAVGIIQPEGFFVKGKDGPLKDGEIERAKDWGRKISETVSKSRV
jgi:hypothetical protein